MLKMTDWQALLDDLTAPMHHDDSLFGTDSRALECCCDLAYLCTIRSHNKLHQNKIHPLCRSPCFELQYRSNIAIIIIIIIIIIKIVIINLLVDDFCKWIDSLYFFDSGICVCKLTPMPGGPGLCLLQSCFMHMGKELYRKIISVVIVSTLSQQPSPMIRQEHFQSRTGVRSAAEPSALAAILVWTRHLTKLVSSWRFGWNLALLFVTFLTFLIEKSLTSPCAQVLRKTPGNETRLHDLKSICVVVRLPVLKYQTKSQPPSCQLSLSLFCRNLIEEHYSACLSSFFCGGWAAGCPASALLGMSVMVRAFPLPEFFPDSPTLCCSLI